MATLDGQKLGRMLTSYRKVLAEKKPAPSKSGASTATPDTRRTLRNVIVFHAVLISLLVLFFVQGTLGEFGPEAVGAAVATFVATVIVAAVPRIRLAFLLASAASWGFIAFMVVLNVWEDEEEAAMAGVVVGFLAVAALLAVVRLKSAPSSRRSRPATGRTNTIDRDVTNDGEGRSPSNLGADPVVRPVKAPWRDAAMIQWGRRSRGSGAAIEWGLVDRRR